MSNESATGRQSGPWPERSPLGKLRAAVALPFFMLAIAAGAVMLAALRSGKIVAGGDFDEIF